MAEPAVVVVDRDGLVRYWSTGAEALLGFRAGDVVGTSVEFVIPSEMRDRHWAAFGRAMATGRLQEERAGVLPLVTGTGPVVPLLGKLMLVTDATGLAVGAIGVFVDSRSADGAAGVEGDQPDEA